MWFSPTLWAELAILPGKGGRARRPSLEREGSSLTRLGGLLILSRTAQGKLMVASHGAGIWPLLTLYLHLHEDPVAAWFILSILLTTHLLLSPKHRRFSIYPFYLVSLRAHIYLPSCPSVCTDMHPASCPAILSTHPSTTSSSNHPPIQLLILSLIFSHLFVKPHPSLLFYPPSIHTHICSYMYSHSYPIQIHPSIIYISIHHFTPPLTHPHRSLLS